MSLRSQADLKFKRETWAAESSEDQCEPRPLEVGDERAQGGGQRVKRGELRAVPWGSPALKVLSGLEGLRQRSLEEPGFTRGDPVILDRSQERVAKRL